MKNNKALRWLFSFVVAIGLWLFVVTNVSTGDSASLNNIPVNLLNRSDLKAKGLILVSGEDATVSLGLYGNRTDLWKLTRDNVNITADLGYIEEAGTYDLTYTVTFPDGIEAEAEERRPSRVSVVVADYDEKNVPVNLIYTGEMAEGLLLDKENAALDYNAITVAGPKDVVEKIARADIEIDRSKLTETLNASYRFTLVDENGEPVDVSLISTNTAEVSLRLPVEHIKEIPLRVTLAPGGGATDINAVVTFSTDTIMISGSEDALSQLDELVLGEIPLGSIERVGEFEFPLNLPESVTNRSGPTAVQVKVALKDLETRTFTISQFQAINLPEGLEATVMTQQVEVRIRGPKGAMAKVTAENILATVDYKGQDAGTVTVPVTITVKGQPSVGALGKVSITVTLAPPSETEPEET